MLLTEPELLSPPPGLLPQDWVLDTGNRGEGFAWRHHLLQAGLDPNLNRLPQSVTITAALGGKLTVPIRKVDLWLVSNRSGAQLPFRIALHRGLPFIDVPDLPDPKFQCPLIGIRALRSAGLIVGMDFARDTVSVWAPESL
jgi:hypothetical protein